MRRAENAVGERSGLREAKNAGPEERGRAHGYLAQSAVNPRAIWAMVYRNRLAMALIVAASLLIGLASVLFTPRYYEATASIQIDQQTAKVLGTEEAEPLASGSDAERFLQTQVDVLKSRAMARRVSDRLALPKSDDFLANTDHGSAGDVSAAEHSELVLDALQDNLFVDLKRNSRVVGIAFRSQEPALAARVANAYAEAFIEGNIQRKFSASEYSRQFLQNQLGLAKDRLEASERALISYARASRLIDASDGATQRGEVEPPRSLVTANLVQLNRAYVDAKALRLRTQQGWEQARDVPALTLPEVLSNPAMQQLLQRRAEVEAELGEMRQHLKPDHPTVLRATAQLDELGAQARSLAESIRDSIRNQYLTAQRQEAAIGAQVNALKTASLSEQDLGVRYNILRREVDTNRQMYDSLLQRFKVLSAEAGVTNNNITVVDTADVPRRPASPQPLLNIALALACGILLAFLYAYGRETLDDAIRDPRDVGSKLHLPLLGVIPEFADGDLQKALDAPFSEVAKAYQTVRSSLELSSNAGLPSSLLVTSSNDGEGKSTTAYMLACDFARLGRNVLLVEADLRSPSLHRLFDVSPEAPGLSSVLAGLIPASEAIHPAGQGLPAFLSSGPLPPDPGKLLGGAAADEFLSGLVGLYDVVVLDGPSATSPGDSAQLAAASDATVFVVEAGTVHFGQARAAVARLTRARGKLIGCVVTKYNARKVGYTDDSGYDPYDYAPGELRASARL